MSGEKKRRINIMGNRKYRFSSRGLQIVFIEKMRLLCRRIDLTRRDILFR